jgi:hypothetical protein
VRWVDRLDPGSCESEISRWSRHFIEQASCESEHGQGVSFVVLTRSVFVGKAFGVVFSGVCFSLSLIVGTLVLIPDSHELAVAGER